MKYNEFGWINARYIKAIVHKSIQKCVFHINIKMG